MKALKSFLADTGMTQTEFAELIGVTPGRVWHYLHDPKAIPRAKLVAKIEKVTNGKVTLRDWVKSEAA